MLERYRKYKCCVFIDFEYIFYSNVSSNILMFFSAISLVWLWCRGFWHRTESDLFLFLLYLWHGVCILKLTTMPRQRQVVTPWICPENVISQSENYNGVSHDTLIWDHKIIQIIHIYINRSSTLEFMTCMCFFAPNLLWIIFFIRLSNISLLMYSTECFCTLNSVLQRNYIK